MTDAGFDSLLPPAMARKAEALGVAKVELPAGKLFALAVLAGAFIAFGGMFSTLATTGASALPYGLVRVLAGVTFSLGLILVVIGGAELFTGNNLMVMALASRRVTLGAVARSWAIVYLGNFVGSVLVALLVFGADYHHLSAGRVGAQVLAVAAAKSSLPFVPALVRGVLGNILVCLAVWLCMSARTDVDKILALVGPITAFVAANFEHSIANMYFLTLGWLVKVSANAAFWTATGLDPAAFDGVTVMRGLWGNLIPVTLGNVIGGTVFVGLTYWFIYLRIAPSQSK